MSRRMGLLMVLIALDAVAGGDARQLGAQVEITAVNNTDRERVAADQLRRILASYELDSWLFTRAVRIDESAQPHSHPVLTLNANYLGDDVRQLSTFLHEQIHWFASADTARAEAVLAELRATYPDVPVGGVEGARSEFSTHLHLAVCRLELDALTHSIGVDAARSLLSAKPFYRWIYERVLHDSDSLGAILSRHGMILTVPGVH